MRHKSGLIVTKGNLASVRRVAFFSAPLVFAYSNMHGFQAGLRPVVFVRESRMR